MKKFIGLILISILTLSCGAVLNTTNATGSLSVSISGGQGSPTSRTITADFTTQADSYGIRLTNQLTDEIKEQLVTGGTSYTFSNLEVGTWDVEVVATKGGVEIARGAAPGQVMTAGLEAQVLVTLAPTTEAGTGEFVFKARYPSDIGIDSVLGALDGTSITPVITVNGLVTTAEFTGNGVSSGVHKLFLTFSRGSAPAGVFVESVNVWNGTVSDRWIANDGSLVEYRDYAAGDFFGNNSNLADLEITQVSTSTLIDFGFSSALTNYDAVTVHDASIAIRFTESVEGQYLEYKLDGGAWIELHTTESTQIELSPPTTALTIRVTAPDSATTREYLVDFLLQMESPIFTPPEGLYTTTQTVTISTETVGASIRYTTDGTEPTSTTGVLYESPILVDSMQTINAVAYKTGWDNSPKASVIYVIGYLSPTVGILKHVPAGSFQRDNTATNISTVSPFYISETEITRAQFLAVMGTDPSSMTYSSGTTDPVQMTSWYHAIAFCNKLSLIEGLTPVYSVTGVDFASITYAAVPVSTGTVWDTVSADWSANGYRLPTEMEWMWAAMGATSDLSNGYTGTGTNTTGYLKAFSGSTGSNVIGDFAWSWTNSSSKTHPAGTKLPNELGLYDMSGNVWEWNWDWFGTYPTGALTDYQGAALSTVRILRGGSWFDDEYLARVSCRSSASPNYGSPNFGDSYIYGFRVVRR